MSTQIDNLRQYVAARSAVDKLSVVDPLLPNRVGLTVAEKEMFDRLDFAALLAEVDAMQSVITKLPMLADGTRFVTGMTVWAVVGTSIQEWHDVLIVDYDLGLRSRKGFNSLIEPEDAYSTREAAESARAKAGAR